MRLFGRGGRHDEQAPLTQEDVRDEMTRTDPEYARVRKALHEGRNLQTAARKQAMLEGLERRARRIETIEETWRRNAGN